jgi:hypothetical protein
MGGCDDGRGAPRWPWAPLDPPLSCPLEGDCLGTYTPTYSGQTCRCGDWMVVLLNKGSQKAKPEIVWLWAKPEQRGANLD